jgi:hypothetical protein
MHRSAFIEFDVVLNPALSRRCGRLHNPHQPYFQTGGKEYEKSFRVTDFGRPLHHCLSVVTRT